MEPKFHGNLKLKIHKFVMSIYGVSRFFPKEEKFGAISQINRASLSVMLNYIEGFARRKEKVKLQFYEISHGSLKESKYLLYFAYCQKWIEGVLYRKIIKDAEEISKMLWSVITNIEKEINE